MAINLTQENYEEIMASDKLVVIDFWAEWCGPCRMVSPIIDELADEYEGKAIICKCDVDDNDEIVSNYSVRNIPTVVFVKGGQMVDKQVGAATKSAFAEKIEKNL